MSGSYDFWVLFPSLVAGGLSGAIVAGINYIATERSNRMTFRRERLFDLKLEAFTELLASSDALISAFEIATSPAIPDLKESLKKSLVEGGASEPIAELMASRFAGTIATSMDWARWSALGVSVPRVEADAKSAVGAAVDPQEALRAAEADLIAQMAPMLEVMVKVQKRVDRAFVQLSLFGVSPDVERSLKRFRHRLENIGFQGGVALGRASAEAKEKFGRDLRADWERIARTCGKDLEDTMN